MDFGKLSSVDQVDFRLPPELRQNAALLASLSKPAQPSLYTDYLVSFQNFAPSFQFFSVRTKYLTLILALSSFFSCEEPPAVRGNAKNPPIYKKSELQKLRWIEGNWKSEVSGTGYYQTYHFPSDSILEVVSYRFDGKDTSGTTISRVYWRNNHIYLGTYDEWVAVLMDKKSIQLDPIRDGWIAISWTQNSKDEWTSVQKKPDFERTVKMKRQPGLSELLKK